MIASHVPPEIWTQIFRACILDSNDWEKQRAADLEFRSVSWSFCYVHGGTYPGAQSLALVCRKWATLVIGDSRLRFVEVTVKSGLHISQKEYLDEIESAISSHPFSSLHLYFSVNLTPNLIHFFKSHSERIRVLSLNSLDSWTYFIKMNPISFPRLEYFHWSVASHGDDWSDEESLEPDIEGEPLLTAFISNHSRSLRCLWLDAWSPNSIQTSLISYRFVTLHLDFRNSTELPSIGFLCALMEASPSLVTFGLKTADLRPDDYGPGVDFVTDNAMQMVAVNLRECILDAEATLIFQILYYITMPRLEALKISSCRSRSPIHPRSLPSASSICFPSLVAAAFEPLHPILAHFLSIAVFPCLRELSLYNDGPLLPSSWKCKMFRHCSTISFLHLRGPLRFRNLVLNHLARRNTSLQSLRIDTSVGECHGSHKFKILSTPSVYSLTIEDKYSSNLGVRRKFYQALPTIETLTLDVPVKSLNLLKSFVTFFLPEPAFQGSLLPRLKTLKLFLRMGGIYQKQRTITRLQCSGLLKFLQCRVEAGYGLDTLICNHRIAPRTVIALKEYVHEVIHGDNPEYSNHQYHVFRLDVRGSVRD